MNYTYRIKEELNYTDRIKEDLNYTDNINEDLNCTDRIKDDLKCTDRIKEDIFYFNIVFVSERMGLVNKCNTPVQGAPVCPTSSKVLPPTPTCANEDSCLASKTINREETDSSKVIVFF